MKKASHQAIPGPQVYTSEHEALLQAFPLLEASSECGRKHPPPTLEVTQGLRTSGPAEDCLLQADDSVPWIWGPERTDPVWVSFFTFLIL